MPADRGEYDAALAERLAALLVAEYRRQAVQNETLDAPELAPSVISCGGLGRTHETTTPIRSLDS